MKKLFPLTVINARDAFSLVEVVLALGVVSFALTAMLGLMPIGLNIFRDSIHDTVEADVMRQLVAQFQATPYDQLADSSNMLYFSDQSLPVADDAAGLLGVTYSVSKDTALLSAGGYTNSYLKTVQVFFYTRADRASSPRKASCTNVISVAPGAQ